MSLAFVGLIVYTFFEYLRPDVLFPNLIGVPILRIEAIITGVLCFFEQLAKGKPFIKAPQNYFLLAFLCWLPLTHIFSGGHMLWYARYSFMEFGKIVFMYFVLINLLDTKKRFRIFTAVIILLTLYLAVGAVLQSLFSYALPGFSLEPLRDYQLSLPQASSGFFQFGRVEYSGIFADANDFAQIILIGLAILINYIPATTSAIRKFFLLTGCFLSITAILLTASRGGFLGLSLVLFLYIRRNYGTVKGGVFIAIVITLLLAFGPFLTERLTNLSVKEASAHGRVEAWTAGWYMLWSNPIFGVGYRFFEEHFRRTAHNSMILVGAETGLIGLYLWLGLIYLTYKHIFLFNKKIASDSILQKDKHSINGISDALAGFLATAFFLSRAYIFPMYFLVGLAIAFLKTSKYEFTPFTGNDIILIALLEIGCLIIWKMSLIVGWSLYL